jgi:hypothetical protein
MIRYWRIIQFKICTFALLPFARNRNRFLKSWMFVFFWSLFLITCTKAIIFTLFPLPCGKICKPRILPAKNIWLFMVSLNLSFVHSQCTDYLEISLLSSKNSPLYGFRKAIFASDYYTCKIASFIREYTKISPFSSHNITLLWFLWNLISLLMQLIEYHTNNMYFTFESASSVAIFQSKHSIYSYNTSHQLWFPIKMVLLVIFR